MRGLYTFVWFVKSMGPRDQTTLDVDTPVDTECGNTSAQVRSPLTIANGHGFGAPSS